MLERAEHIEEWQKLTLEKVGQVAPPLGGAQPREQGHRKTAEALGIDKRAVRRAEKIAALPAEAEARRPFWRRWIG